jgi:hypothetical protein
VYCRLGNLDVEVVVPWKNLNASQRYVPTLHVS